MWVWMTSIRKATRMRLRLRLRMRMKMRNAHVN